MNRQREALHRGRQPDLSPELQVQPNSPRTVPERQAWARLAGLSEMVLSRQAPFAR
ncbi:MAG: hypothetical protein WBD15_16195 [Pseudolabrys sp.]|jgi:hypothetical protein